MTKKPLYTTILHEKRVQFGLSISEYCVADSIDKLSNNPPQYEWCIMSRANMGAFVDLSARQVARIIRKLEQLNFVIIQPKTGYVRTTEKWEHNMVLVERYDKMSGGVGQNVRPTPDKMSDNSINYNHSINTRISSSKKSVSSKGMDDHQIVRTDEDGNEIQIKKKEGLPKVRKNQVAKNLQVLFSEMCLRYVKVKPIIDAKGYFSVLRAMNSGGLKEADIKKLFEEWFMDQPDEKAISLTRALSNRNIEIFKVRNGIINK